MDQKWKFEVGDVVKLKKPHPCGSNEWEILRVGADFRLKCMGCGHQIMVARRLVEKNTRGLTKKRGESTGAAVMKVIKILKNILQLSREFDKIILRDISYPCSCY